MSNKQELGFIKTRARYLSLIAGMNLVQFDDDSNGEAILDVESGNNFFACLLHKNDTFYLTILIGDSEVTEESSCSDARPLIIHMLRRFASTKTSLRVAGAIARAHHMLYHAAWYVPQPLPEDYRGVYIDEKHNMAVL